MKANVHESQDRLITVKEAAELLSCGNTMTYQLINEGHLAKVKLGRLTRVRLSDVNDLIRRGSVSLN